MRGFSLILLHMNTSDILAAVTDTMPRLRCHLLFYCGVTRNFAGFFNWYKILNSLRRPVASRISIWLPCILLWHFWHFPHARPSWPGRIRSSWWRSETHILQMVCPCSFRCESWSLRILLRFQYFSRSWFACAWSRAPSYYGYIFIIWLYLNGRLRPMVRIGCKPWVRNQASLESILILIQTLGSTYNVTDTKVRLIYILWRLNLQFPNTWRCSISLREALQLTARLLHLINPRFCEALPPTIVLIFISRPGLL